MIKCIHTIQYIIIYILYIIYYAYIVYTYIWYIYKHTYVFCIYTTFIICYMYNLPSHTHIHDDDVRLILCRSITYTRVRVCKTTNAQPSSNQPGNANALKCHMYNARVGTSSADSRIIIVIIILKWRRRAGPGRDGDDEVVRRFPMVPAPARARSSDLRRRRRRRRRNKLCSSNYYHTIRVYDYVILCECVCGVYRNRQLH